MQPDAEMNASSPMTTLIGQLLGAGVVFHIHHFRAPSHSKHVVLDTIYKMVIDFGDQLAEQAAGAGLFDPDLLEGIAAQPTPDPLDDLSSLISILEDSCSTGYDAAINNTLQEFVSGLRQQFFLLRME